jgi:uncharacterized protein
MRVLVGSLQEGENRLAEDATAEAVGLPADEFRFRGPIHVDLSLYRQGREIQVEGRVTGVSLEDCDRCLATFERRLDAEFRVLADEPRAHAPEGIGADEDSEMYIIQYEHGALELGPVIREAIVLERPIRNLCTPQCRGVCPGCGANLNQEPCGCGLPGSRPDAAGPARRGEKGES